MFREIDKIELYSDMTPGYAALYNPWVGNHSQKNREQMIADIATISYGNESAKNPTALYNKLIEVKHLSVFEFLHTSVTSEYSIPYSLRHDNFNTYEYNGFGEGFVSTLDERFMQSAACFKIKVPIIVARQFMRHRGFSYLEMSRRYVKNTKVPFEFITDYDPACKQFNEISINEYNRRISLGEKPETARGCIGTDAYTEFFVFGDHAALKNFFALRTDAHAQLYIRQCAESMLNLLKKNQPCLYERM